MRVAILGLGQIGGSVGRALVAAGDPWRVAGWTRSADARHAAAADGIDVAGSIGEACTGADAIVLAVPPLACLELLDELAGGLRSATDQDAVITDVASTKAAICARAAGHGLRFVGGHPMAGREASGYAAADAALFAGRPWVIVPSDPPDIAAEDRVANIAATCGARIVRLGAVEHDAAVGAISHLPLVVAAALVESVAGGLNGAEREDWPVAAGLAATGWEGMTRLARGDVEMGTGIAATNAPAIASRLRDLRSVLDAWLAYLEGPSGPDAAQIEARLLAAREMLKSTDAEAAE